MNRDDLRDLANERLEDARVLLEKGRYAAAYYLSGYVVECALKACIAKQTKQFDFPPAPAAIQKIYVHDLAALMKSAGLEDTLEGDSERDEEFAQNWALVKDWNEKCRYKTEVEARKAQGLLEAISDDRHGVLQWIKRHW